MNFWSKMTLASVGLAIVLLGGLTLSGQAPQGKAAPKGKAAPAPAKAADQAKAAPSGKITAAQFFKNVTTQTPGALSPNAFSLAIGVLCEDLGVDCADCHLG